MKTVANVIGVARSNLAERAKHAEVKLVGRRPQRTRTSSARSQRSETLPNNSVEWGSFGILVRRRTPGANA